MKHTILSLCSVLLLTTSCSDWLDVNPVNEIREAVLFQSEAGYKDALTGVYIQLGSGDMYGRALSMHIPEMLAHTWTIPTESRDPAAYYLARFDYTNTNVESAIGAVWSKTYTAIAQLNDIIINIEDTNVSFSNGNKELIAGEAYGLRAFLHLDLLRLFGPVPGQGSGTTACIPYVTDMTTDVAQLQSASWDQVVTGILADLNKAEELLKDEPAVRSKYALDASSTTVGFTLNDAWQYYRQIRFNYWAAIGTKARLYYWTGQKDKAAEYALKTIDATDKNGETLFTLTDAAYFSANVNANYNMKSEHLFGVYNSNFSDDILKYYTNANARVFTQEESYVSTAYESALYQDDIRNKGTRYWENKQDDGSTTYSYQYKKYFYAGSAYGRYTIPVMRLSEMYFIVFECKAITDMMPRFKTWRLARGLDSSVDGTLTSESTVLARLEKEWRKEFFGEGQMFYFYKKHNYASYSWPTTFNVPSGAYKIPQPQSQTLFE